MIRLAGAVAALFLGWTSIALAQDTPPPGCRWQGSTLACKDGKGHWRRAGDDEIVGTYPLGDLRSKPKPAPRPAASPPAPAPVEAAPPVEETTIVSQPPPEPSVAPAPQPAPVAEPPPERKSWWRRWLDDIWNDILGFLRMVGLIR